MIRKDKKYDVVFLTVFNKPAYIFINCFRGLGCNHLIAIMAYDIEVAYIKDFINTAFL